MSTPEKETHSSLTSTTGGVMTVEVGAVTGELEIATRPAGDNLEVRVRYAGAEEWYAVEGEPIALEDAGSLSPPELRELHERIVRYLGQSGQVVSGNEQPTSLRGLSLTLDDA